MNIRNFLFLFRDILILAALLSLPVASQATDHYIRAGATGTANGSDWTNAWTNIPATLIRGDTYYIASGAYASHTFQALDGTSYVYLKKATMTSHGTATGWNDIYASGPAVFSGLTVWTINMSYLDVDGVVGSGSNSSDYGIRLNSSATSQGDGAIVIPNNGSGSTSSHTRFRHLALNNATWGNSNGSGVYYNTGSINTTDNNFEYSYFEGGRAWIWFAAGGGSNTTVDHSYFKNAGSDDPTLHSAGLIMADFTQFTVRYSVFENMMGGSNTTYIEPQFSSSSIDVYGNIFKGTSPNESTGQGIFAITSTDTCTNCHIYNNTIVGLHTFPGIWCGHHSGQEIYVDNNLWQDNYASVSIVGDGGATCIVGPNNLLNGGASFINQVAGNFELTTHTAAGTSLFSPYNMDPVGVNRGTSGTWDIGAFAYGSALALAAPSNLRIIP
ncbi:MAG: hypothetical protein ACXWMH_07445 [Syntrophales bacterium]